MILPEFRRGWGGFQGWGGPPCPPRAASLRCVARALLLVSVGAFLGACRIGGSSTLLDEANVQLLVSGLAPGERLRVTVGDEVRQTVGGESEPLVLYLQLDAGAYTGALEAGDADAAPRCGAFAVAIDDDADVDVVAIDAAALAPCTDVDVDVDAGPGEGEGEGEGEGDDAGIELPDAGIEAPDAGIEVPDAGEDVPDAGNVIDTFVLLEETVSDAVCSPPCSVVTTVRSDGTVTVIDRGAAPQVATLPEPDLDAIALATANIETDELFTGLDLLCPQLSLLGLVTLRRELDADGGGTNIDTVDVSVCLDGTAAQLRARLDLARTFLP